MEKMTPLRKKQTRQSGFTLLELMVVVVILGVLASLVVPNVLGNKAQADKQKAKADIMTLENALDMYKIDNNQYPTTEQGLKALVNKPQTQPFAVNYRDNGYIRRLPQDPWSQDYKIRSPGQHGDIDIYSAGPDGIEGNEDDIANWLVDKK